MPDSCECIEIRVPVPWGYLAGSWYGDRRRRPLVALHGWQDNSGTFATLAPLIAKNIPVLAIDLPGHGRSSHLPIGIVYHSWDFVQALRCLHKHFKWSRISLMGHSMGAMACYNYATLFPNDTDLIICFDLLHTRYFPLDIQINILQMVADKNVIENERVKELNENVNLEPPLYSIDELEEMLWRSAEYTIDKNNCKYLLKRSIKPSKYQKDRYYIVRDGRVKVLSEPMFDTQLARTFAERIHNFNILILSAKDSYIFDNYTKPELLALLKENNRNFEHYKLPDVTHFLHLNNPEKVYEYIESFLSKHWMYDELEEKEIFPAKL